MTSSGLAAGVVCARLSPATSKAPPINAIARIWLRMAFPPELVVGRRRILADANPQRISQAREAPQPMIAKGRLDLQPDEAAREGIRFEGAQILGALADADGMH